MTKRRKKKPTREYNPPTGRRPRSDKSLYSTDDQKVEWKFGFIDKGGLWGFEKLTQKEFWDIILPTAKNYETMTWAEIKHRPHNHEISIDKIISEAKRRLKQIEKDDTDELFSMVFDGSHRIWGIKHSAEFWILWWDPNHEIYPSPKKHT